MSSLNRSATKECMTSVKSIEECFRLTNFDEFSPANQQTTFVLSGGIGSLLERLGYASNDHELWSGGANIDRPDLVLHAHKMLIDVGADVILTNTYHCSIQKLIDVRGYTIEEAEHVIKKAVSLAQRAIAESRKSGGRRVRLVGSIGPYATYLRDGSEYSGYYVNSPDFDPQTIVSYYRRQARPLLDAGVSCILFETIPTMREVECLGIVLDELCREWPNLCVWITVTCKDGVFTRGGDNFAGVMCLANSLPGVACVGTNCTSPAHITSLLRAARDAIVAGGNAPPRFVIYPNSGENFNTTTRNFEGTVQIIEILDGVPEWRALGTRVIGGCCRVTPLHLREIAACCRTPLSQSL